MLTVRISRILRTVQTPSISAIRSEIRPRGEIVLFDRSWYNRAGVERVMKFCSEDEYQEFLRSCPVFEEMLVRSGIYLIKYWFSVNDEEQERRF
jgi:polyphosphate kinase 2 (PPK2 family)